MARNAQPPKTKTDVLARLRRGVFRSVYYAQETEPMNTELSTRYIEAKYKGATRAQLLELQDDAAKELKAIKAAKSDVFARYTGVHGRFQQSQLDVLDIRENNICALFDNVSDMLVITKN